MILDTDFIIDIMAKEESAVRKLGELIERGEPQIVTAPSIFELYSGVGRSKIPETEKQKIVHILSNLIIWPLDAESAESGGEIDGNLTSEGAKIDPIDSMIAGIAVSKRETVLTRNVKHFSRIASLKVEKAEE